MVVRQLNRKSVPGVRRSRSPNCSGRGSACPRRGVGQRDQSTSPAPRGRTDPSGDLARPTDEHTTELRKSLTAGDLASIGRALSPAVTGGKEKRPHGDSNPGLQDEKPYGSIHNIFNERELRSVANALAQLLAQNSPTLATVIAAWPSLPAPIRAGIVAMVQASTVNR